MVIFSTTQKKKLAIALVAVSLGYASQSHTGVPTDVNETATGTKASNADAPNSNALSKMYQKLAGFILKSKYQVDSFFNRGNNESYKSHIKKMDDELKNLETDIREFRQNLESDSTASRNDSLFNAIIRKTDEIINRVHNNLGTLHKALANQQGKQAPVVINALKNIQKELTNNIALLNQNINELHALVLQYDKSKNNTDLTKQVQEIQKALKVVNDAKVNAIEVVLGVGHRVQCR
jgi:prefoldin subunit 5